MDNRQAALVALPVILRTWAEDSGAIGFQAMAGVDYAFSDRLYLTTELRYSSLTGLDLSEEDGDGRISDIDYQPVTLGVGLGLRF